MTPLAVTAPAKINLFLHITGKRRDGFHLLESLVVFTEFGDTLEIVPAKLLTLGVSGPFAEELTASAEPNLVIKAASMLRFRTGSNEGAHIVLHKHIPIAAGLGGGSSDAAAALKGLRQFWKLYGDERILAAVAKELGSDVPACLVTRPSWVTGAGEQVMPVEVNVPLWLVLVNPGIALSTAQVYKQFSGHYSPPSVMPKPLTSFEEVLTEIKPRHNALEAAAIGLVPDIGHVLAALRATGCALARLCGSGATCFGLYAKEQDARQAHEHLQQSYPHWWSVVTHGQAQ